MYTCTRSHPKQKAQPILTELSLISFSLQPGSRWYHQFTNRRESQGFSLAACSRMFMHTDLEYEKLRQCKSSASLQFSLPLRMLYLQSGQFACIRSHFVMHIEWKWWLQGRADSSTPSSYDERHMQHSASSRRRIRSLVDVPLLLRIGIITPSSVPFSPFSLGSEYLYLGRTPISASDAPSWPTRAYSIATTQGKQQHSATPMKQATTTQKTAKKTSNARKTTVNLHNKSEAR